MKNERNQTVKTSFKEQASQFLKDKKRRNRVVALTGAVAILVAFVIGNATIKPAISMTDGEIKATVVHESTALSGTDTELQVRIEARAGRNSDTRFTLKTDANGAEVSNVEWFTRTEYTDEDGFFTDEEGTLLDETPEAGITTATIIDENGNEIELTRDASDEYGVVEYSFVLSAESYTAFTLGFAEGAFEETVEEEILTVERAVAEDEVEIEEVTEELQEDAEEESEEEIIAEEAADEDLEIVEESANEDLEIVDESANEELEIIEEPANEVPEPVEGPTAIDVTDDITVETEEVEIDVNNAEADVVELEDVTAEAEDEAFPEPAAWADGSADSAPVDETTENAVSVELPETVIEAEPLLYEDEEEEEDVLDLTEEEEEIPEEESAEEELLLTEEEAEEETDEIIAEVNLTAKTYTLTFVSAFEMSVADEDAETEEAEEEFRVVSDVILVTDMEYLNGSEVPENENMPVLLSWTNRIADAEEDIDRTLVEQSAFFKRTVTATIYEDESYQEMRDDSTVITVEGAMPEDVIALAYPIFEEADPATDAETATTDYEVVCTYDIALFRSATAVRIETEGSESEMLADEVGAASDASDEETEEMSVDTGSVDENVVVNIDGRDYFKYEPTPGNRMTVKIVSDLLSANDGDGYGVLRTEEIGAKTQMETAPALSAVDNATSVTFYTDHFTPYSVIREKNQSDLLWLDPVNGTAHPNLGDWGPQDGLTEGNPTSTLGWAFERAKHNGNAIIVSLETQVIDQAYVSQHDQNGDGVLTLPDDLVGSNNGYGWHTIRMVRKYENIGTADVNTDENASVDGFGKAIFVLKDGVRVVMKNMDINGAGVDAVEPLIIMEGGAQLTLENTYIHHGYNTREPETDDEKNNGVFGRGGAINLTDASLIVGNSTIEACEALHGGGIYSTNSKVVLNDKGVITKCDVNNDYPHSAKTEWYGTYFAPRMGGGIAVRDGSLVMNDGAEISENGAFYGGGIYADGAAVIEIKGGQVTKNIAGAKYEDGKRVTGNDPTVAYSLWSIPSGAGIFMANAAKLDPDYSGRPMPANGHSYLNVDGWPVPDKEGARRDGLYSLMMSGGEVSDNISYGYSGGGITLCAYEICNGNQWACDIYEHTLKTKPTSTISGGVISGNVSKDMGGGIFVGWAELFIIAENGNIVEIKDNSSTGYNEAETKTYCMNNGYNGGGMFIYKGGKVTIYDCLITQNRTTTVHDWETVRTYGRPAGTAFWPNLRDGQWNGGGGIASCKSSETKFNNNRGVAVFDNEIPTATAVPGVKTNTSYATGTDLMLVAQDLGGGELNYYHNTYMAIDMPGGGKNNFYFDNTNQVASSYYDSIPEHEMYMPHGTEYRSENILPVRILDGEGLSIQLKNDVSQEDKDLAWANAKVRITGNSAYTKGGGIGNNGELVFGANSHAVQLYKVDGEDTSKLLSGAVFALTKLNDNGTTVYTTLKQTPSDGRIVFWDLSNGEYRISESVAPQGYTPRTKVWKIKVQNDGIYQEKNGDWVKLAANRSLGPRDEATGFEPQLFTLQDEDGADTIKNYETDYTTKLTVSKSWITADGDPLAADKMTEVVMELYGGPSLAAQEALGQTATLNADNNWTATFENLPVFWGDESNGIAAVYTAKEQALDDFKIVEESFGAGKWVKTDKFEYGKLYALVRNGTDALIANSGETGVNALSLVPFDPNSQLSDVDANAVWTVSRNKTSNGTTVFRLKTLSDGRIFGSEMGSEGYRVVSIRTTPDDENDGFQIVESNRLVMKGGYYFCTKQPDGWRLRNSGTYYPAEFDFYYWDSGVTSTADGAGTWSSVASLVAGQAYVFTLPYVNNNNQVGTDNMYWVMTYDGSFYNGNADFNGGNGVVAVARYNQIDLDDAKVVKWIPENTNQSGLYYLKTENAIPGKTMYMAYGGSSGDMLCLTENRSKALTVRRLSDGALQIGNGQHYISIGVPTYESGTVQPIYQNLPQGCTVKIIPGIFTQSSGEIMGYNYGVVNQEIPRYVMPSTGGMGTHWFYLIGFGILAVIGVVLYNKKFD